jgi:hypothetical protein
MKKLVLTAFAVTCAASVFAQGTVIFNNRITGTLVTHVYSGGTTQYRGNGSTDTPAGTQDWTGFTALTGSGYSAAILSATGAGQAESSLAQAPFVTSFRTGTAAGQFATGTATLANVAGDAPMATLEVVAWDNKGGTVTSWAQAQPLWLAGTIAAGTSGTFNVGPIGGAVNGAATMTGLPSFNIYTAVPEPSTMALAGLGAAALLIFRRRK